MRLYEVLLITAYLYELVKKNMHIYNKRITDSCINVTQYNFKFNCKITFPEIKSQHATVSVRSTGLPEFRV